MFSKTKSMVWNFHDKTADDGVCKLCRCCVKTSGNTINLQNHMKRKHLSVNTKTDASKIRRQSNLISEHSEPGDIDDPDMLNEESYFAGVANEIINTVSNKTIYCMINKIN